MAKKSLFWLVTSILVLITVYILTTTVILPVATKNPLPEAVLPKAEVKRDNNAKKSEKPDNAPKKSGKTDKGAKKADPKVQNKPASEGSVSNSKDDLTKYFELKKAETMLRSRYSLSSEDSIYLVLDLITKVATLEMKGIPLHDSKIKKVWISNSIRMFHTEALLQWIAQPFVLKNVNSTIERVQFLVKNAPKDTIEANKTEAIPAPRRTEDVYIVLNFERNLQLVIQQAEISEGADKARIDSLKNNLLKKETEKSLKALSSFKRDAITPKIIITLPKSDAVTLYRALPQKLKMVLRM
ncbi:MAG: hypothetical protein M0Q53_09010 [Prolixibacteraceae bacterium]|jgi:hypothetical protein|nr:hypothetical protein [Prolixibacteraceae bacterium]